MDWYYAESGQSRGPISEEDWHVLVDSGRVGPQTMVWHQGLPDWKAYAEVSPPAGQAPGAGAADGRVACRECGKVVSFEEALQYGELWVCSSCKPRFLQRIREEGRQAATDTVLYGGFWIRFAAKILDWIIIGAFFFVLWIAATPLFVLAMKGAKAPPDLGKVLSLEALLYLIQITVTVSYSAFFLGKFSATPGKMLCGLKVLKADGGKVTYKRGMARGFAEILSGLIFYIGYIIAAFDGQKRAFHDHLCSTRVVYK